MNIGDLCQGILLVNPRTSARATIRLVKKIWRQPREGASAAFNTSYWISLVRSEIIRRVGATRALHADVTAEVLADIDLGQGVVMHLICGDLPTIGLGHPGDLLLLTIGGGNRPGRVHLEIAVALDPRGRGLRSGQQRQCAHGEAEWG